MKVAFVGKGGSGKTTVSSLFVRDLARRGLRVVAIDADINQHLGVALGLSEEVAAAIPPLGLNLTALKDYLRGNNPRITSVESMLKSTPAGGGSRLLRVNGDDLFHREYGVEAAGGATLMATGPFAEDDLGLSCYHSKIGAAELYLNHVVDGPGEYVVVDMTAGADAFASGLFTRFDVTFLVAEPTRKGVSVYHQYKKYAEGHDVKICVIGNKINDEADLKFLRDNVGDDLLTYLVLSDFVRKNERGQEADFGTLESQNVSALGEMLAEVNETRQDWMRFTQQGHEFHRLYAGRWGGAADGEDLAQQIDPDFVMGPNV